MSLDEEREEQISRLLGSEHIKYQNIDLGGGSATGGYRRNSMDEVLFGSDLTGLTLLDIGSSLGHFCLEALKRGAAAATGLETSPERIRHAREIAAVVNLSAEYIHADFEEWGAPPRSYDVVLCLNVLHHLYDPVAAIRKMMGIARKRIYLEVAPVNRREIMKVANPLALLGGPSAPIMLLGDPENSTRAADRTFTFTRQALSVIMNGHSKAFEPLRFYPSSFKGRLIVEARRREIGHLVVIAGVTGVGKSTFIERLRASPELQSRFGIEGAFEVAQANRIDELRPGRHDTLLYHYDILRPFDRPLHSHGRDPAFHLLSSAERITLINLANAPQQLRERITSATAQPAKLQRKARKRHEVILKQYENPSFLIAWYEAWLAAAGKYMGRHADRSHLVLSDDAYTEVPDLVSLEDILRQTQAP